MVDPIGILVWIGGLAYLFSPLDFIPDLVPGIGIIDDLAVMLGVFLFWRNRNKKKANSGGRF